LAVSAWVDDGASKAGWNPAFAKATADRSGAPLWRAGEGDAQRLPGRADGARINAVNAGLPLRFKPSFFAFLAFFTV